MMSIGLNLIEFFMKYKEEYLLIGDIDFGLELDFE